MAAVHPLSHPDLNCPTCGTPTDSTTSTPAHTELLESELRNLSERYLTVSNQLRELEEQHHHRSPRPTIDTATRSLSADHSPFSPSTPDNVRPTAGLTRFASSFRLPITLSASSSTSNIFGSPTAAVAAAAMSELQRELAVETAAREEAEVRARMAHAELEDLTSQLFEQANLMVASERRVNARLGEKVALLEQRDKVKAKRLERIECALRRIERVRGVLERR